MSGEEGEREREGARRNDSSVAGLSHDIKERKKKKKTSL